MIEFDDSSEGFDRLIRDSLTSRSLTQKRRSDTAPEAAHDVLRQSFKKMPIQFALDLHGMNRKEARLSLESFLIENYRKQNRKLRIITGKGNNSVDRMPVIKPETEQILQEDRFGIIGNYYPDKERYGEFGSFIVILKSST